MLKARHGAHVGGLRNAYTKMAKATSIPSTTVWSRTLQRRWDSTTTTMASSASSSSSKRWVTSRRIWNAYQQQSLPPKSNPTSSRFTKNPADEKPWPRSIQIAGYVLAGTCIPYTTLWILTSNPTLRTYTQSVVPFDHLRHHFGELEWDAQSFEDARTAKTTARTTATATNDSTDDRLPTQYWKFPQEWPYLERKQQELIDQLDAMDHVVNLYRIGQSSTTATSSSPHQYQLHPMETRTKRVKGSVRVNQKTLGDLFLKSDGKMGMQQQTMDDDGADTMIAVDFQDDTDHHQHHHQQEHTIGEGMEMSDGTTFQDVTITDHSTNRDEPTDPIQAFLRKTHTFSSWYYHSAPLQLPEMKQTSKHDIEILRLEHTIDQLQKELQNPSTSARSIDDMNEELSKAKGQLRSLKWKRRLGM